MREDYKKTLDALRSGGYHERADTLQASAEGFSGVLSNGNLVDRRKYLHAIPVKKSSVLGTSEPKEVTSKDVIDRFITFVADNRKTIDHTDDETIKFWRDKYFRDYE